MSFIGEYAKYVEQVRKYAKEMPFEEAVGRAVDFCIRNGILEEFLSKNRAEAIAVSIFEYNEEKHIENERETAYRIGKSDGWKEGQEEGTRALIRLSREFGNSRQETLKHIMGKMNLSQAEAEECMEKYWHETL